MSGNKVKLKLTTPSLQTIKNRIPVQPTNFASGSKLQRMDLLLRARWLCSLHECEACTPRHTWSGQLVGAGSHLPPWRTQSQAQVFVLRSRQGGSNLRVDGQMDRSTKCGTCAQGNAFQP